MTPAHLIMAVFFLHAIGIANWFPRIAEMQAKLGVSAGELSYALLGMPAATVVAVPFAGAIIGRFGARRVIGLALLAIAVVLALPPWMWSVPSLFASLFLIGLFYPVVDIAMNVEADRIERATGKRIMATCHGCWSVGSVAGFGLASVFIYFGVDPRWHLLAVALAMLPFAILVPRGLPDMAPSGDDLPRRALTLPSVGMIGLCVFLFGTLMIEASARNWIAVYISDVIHADPVYSGITLGVFSFFMAVGRFTGDRIVTRFGPVAVARICCLIATAGLFVAVVARTPLEVVAGFAAAGLGIALGFPLAVTAAAGRGDRPPAANVAGLQLIGVVAFLINPPLIGQVADWQGLRIGLAIVLPMILLSVVLAGELRRTARPGAAVPELRPPVDHAY